MADVLVDTNVFIDHLNGSRRFEPGEDRVWYSVVTRFELFASKQVSEDVLQLLLSPFTEITIDRDVAERAGRLRRTLSIRTPDALIAASALEYGLTLLTSNVKDFRTVPELQISAPK